MSNAMTGAKRSFGEMMGGQNEDPSAKFNQANKNGAAYGNISQS
jgi:hypothetical protein